MNEKLAINIDCEWIQVVIDSDTKQVLGVRVGKGTKTTSFGMTELVDRVVEYNPFKE